MRYQTRIMKCETCKKESQYRLYAFEVLRKIFYTDCEECKKQTEHSDTGN